MAGSGRLEGKVAIITGAGSGIGRATAVLFAREGARLALADVNEDGLSETASQTGLGSDGVITWPTDVSREPDVRALVTATVEAFGRLDVLFNNAGISGSIVGPAEQDVDEWRRILDVNLLGAVLGTKHAVPEMQKQGRGAIVNTASVAGIRSGAGPNAYSASKAGVINFTQTSACDLGGENIRVNAVCPGLIETGMTRPVFEYARAHGKEEKLGKRAELLRYGHPEEIAWAVLFLASDEASFITGQALAVDGGNTASLNMPGMKV